MSLVQRENNFYIQLDCKTEIDLHWRSFQFENIFAFEKEGKSILLRADRDELEKIESACLLTTGEIFIVRFAVGSFNLLLLFFINSAVPACHIWQYRTFKDPFLRGFNLFIIMKTNDL